jgi:geranylgeranyl pyrophosphate synthase
LNPPGKAALSLQNNFFSILFLYSYFRAGIEPKRRILYAATLQCLRGMVTGCDNLLDDEYKPTLDTDIPATGYRFRSVVDIMVSDRVLFQVLMAAAKKNEIAVGQVMPATNASMKTMTRSGVEEAEEEAGISVILEPESVLDTIHHLKTGILFQSPWDIPLVIESVEHERLTPLLEGLYRIGIGCQIMDDMVDMAMDIQTRKHNYLISLIHHGSHRAEKNRLGDLMHPGSDMEGTAICADQFPAALKQASAVSRRYLTDGLGMLFSSEHQILVRPAIQFLKNRIGVPQSARGSER